MFKALELAHHPCQKRQIDVPEQWVQPRAGIAPVVRNPSPKEWIEFPSNVLQGQLRLMPECSSPESLPHSLHRRGTNCRIEASEQCLVSETLDQTWPEAEPEKVKFDIRILAFPLSVFAIDDLGFRRMHLQTALRQTSLKLRLKGLCFLLGPTVHQPIICIPTPRELRVCPCHPEIERVVHKQVGQDWANHSALRRAAASLHRGPIFLHHGRLEPSFDVQQRPLTRHMFPNGP